MATTYKVKEWKNTAYYGKVAQAKGNSAKIYFFNGAGEFGVLYSIATKDAIVGVASGRAVVMTNGITYYLITLKTPYQGNAFAYVSIQEFYFLTGKADNEATAKKDAQTLLDKLIISDKKLYEQTIRTAGILGQLDKKGIDTTAQKAKLQEILVAISRRQDAIKSNPFISITKTFNLSGIGCNEVGCDCAKVGFIPLIIIGAGIVIGGFVVYYFLKPEYNTSQLHSEYLTKNEAELKAKLGPEKYAELKQAVDQEIKDEASNAYSEAKTESTFGWIKTLALMAAGFFVVTKIQGAGKK